MPNIWDGIQNTARQLNTSEDSRRVLRCLTITERSADLSTALTNVLGHRPRGSWDDVANALCSSIAAGMVALATVVPDPEAFLSEYLRPHPDGPWEWPFQPGTGRVLVQKAPPHVGPVSILNLAQELAVDPDLVTGVLNKLLTPGWDVTLFAYPDEVTTGYSYSSLLSQKGADAIRAELGPAELHDQVWSCGCPKVTATGDPITCAKDATKKHLPMPAEMVHVHGQTITTPEGTTPARYEDLRAIAREKSADQMTGRDLQNAYAPTTPVVSLSEAHPTDRDSA